MTSDDSPKHGSESLPPIYTIHGFARSYGSYVYVSVHPRVLDTCEVQMR